MCFRTSSLKQVYTAIFITLIFGLFLNQSAHAQDFSTQPQDSIINYLVDVQKALERDNKLGKGYTIQLYYGSLSSANTVLKDYQNYFESWPATIEYETPNYKVWVGNFRDRLLADRALVEVKTRFPSAFVLQK